MKVLNPQYMGEITPKKESLGVPIENRAIFEKTRDVTCFFVLFVSLWIGSRMGLGHQVGVERLAIDKMRSFDWWDLKGDQHRPNRETNG